VCPVGSDCSGEPSGQVREKPGCYSLGENRAILIDCGISLTLDEKGIPVTN
jgi:hypothetical protein